jgi:hypothetical protein
VGQQGATVEAGADVGELHPVVDAVDLVAVLDLDADHPQAAAPGVLDHVGEVLLPLCVGRAERREHLAAQVQVDRPDAAVDLAHLTLGGVRVAVLHHAGDVPGVVPEHPAVAGRVVEHRGHDADRGTGVGGQQPSQRLRPHEGDVAGGDEDPPGRQPQPGGGTGGVQGLQPAPQSTARARHLVLVGHDDARQQLLGVRGHRVAVVAHHDGHRAGGRGQRGGCGEGVAQQDRPPTRCITFGVEERIRVP